MKQHSFTALFCLFVAFLLSSCVSFNAGSDLQRGRYALLRGDAKLAQQHFQQAAATDSSYVYQIGPMKQGVWTYVGRAQYANNDLKSAQTSLEEARKRNADDFFAPVYLGLALSKAGDRQRASKELQTGLTGLNDWLEYITANSSDKAYWDPGWNIRSGIKEQLARLNSKEINWPEVISDTERIGTELETEGDQVNNDKRREQRDDSRAR
jgi:tetratricopeptide (TPR) repeat protein